MRRWVRFYSWVRGARGWRYQDGRERFLLDGRKTLAHQQDDAAEACRKRKYDAYRICEGPMNKAGRNWVTDIIPVTREVKWTTPRLWQLPSKVNNDDVEDDDG
jgi:hypothetical protein